MIYPDHRPGLRPKPAGRENCCNLLKRPADILIRASMRQGCQSYAISILNLVFDHVVLPHSEKLKIPRHPGGPKRHWGDTELRPEGPGKTLIIAVSGSQRDHRHRPICVHQPMRGLMCPDAPDSLRASLARHRDKDTVPMKPRHRRHVRQSIQRKIPRRVVMDIVNHSPQPSFIRDHTRLLHCCPPNMHHTQETSLADLIHAIRLQKPTVPAI